MLIEYVYVSNDPTEVPMRCGACRQRWTSAIRLVTEQDQVRLTPLRAGIDRIPSKSSMH